jgi:Clp amino terminal domain, pathogenicity island component
MITPPQLPRVGPDMEWMSTWASQQARELGHHWFGGEHLLLALSREPSIARDVLGELGVTHERLLEALLSAVGSGDAVTGGQPPHSGTLSAVSFHDLSGCAVGLAAGLGAEQVRPEHVLLAVAWRPDRLAARLLRSLGVQVQRLPAALAQAGVAVPSVPPPSPAPEVTWGPRVDVPIERLMEVTHRLVAERLPPGTPFGFNHDGKGHAWVVAEQGVDLPAEVRSVLSELARSPLGRP